MPTQVRILPRPVGLTRRIEAVEDDAEAARLVCIYHSTRQDVESAENESATMLFRTLQRCTATRSICRLIKAES